MDDGIHITQEDFNQAWDNAFVTESAPSRLKKVARDHGLDIMEIEAFKVLENQLGDKYNDDWDKMQAAFFRMSEPEIMDLLCQFVEKYK